MQDYDPFGMIQVGRSWKRKDYRFSFNGKEDENWQVQDYGFRHYDPLIARFISVDPLKDSYPWYTPFQFAGNNPIYFIDLDGLEPAEPGKELGQEQIANDPNGKEYNWTWQGNESGWRQGVETVDIQYSESKKNEFYRKQDAFLNRVIEYHIEQAKAKYKVAAGGLFQGYPNHVIDQAILNGFDTYWQFYWNRGDDRLPGAHPSATGRIDLAPIQPGDVLILGIGLFRLGSALAVRAAATRMMVVAEGNTAAQSWIQVGRWMSQEELSLMQGTGRVVEGGGGVTFVSTKGASDFIKQASTGSVYVEFEVPINSLLKGGQQGWFKMVGPNANNAMKKMLSKQGGELLPAYKNLSPIIQQK